MNKLLALVACCMGLIDCSLLPLMTLHPKVLIDNTFTDTELAGIVDGLTTWEADEPRVRFDIEMASHTGADENNNTIKIFRVTSVEDTDCPFGPLKDAVAKTHFRQAYSLICINATYVNANPFDGNNWHVVTMHEIGHAFFMRHLSPPAVMAPIFGEQPLHLTGADREEFDKYWGPWKFGPVPLPIPSVPVP